MTINVTQAASTGLALFEVVAAPLTGVEWADEHFYLSAETSGIEGKWKTLPYQIALINWMCDDDIEEFNLQKSSRVGYTKMILIANGYGISEKRRNIAIWQPTDGDAEDFSKDEVDAMLRDVPIVGNLLKCKPGAKSKYNTLNKKVFQGATLDIKGGKSGRNYRRMTKDWAFYDETDGFDTDVDGEGSPFELGDVRIQTSSFPKSVRGSSPKTKGISLIEAALKECRFVFYRFVKCPQCGTLQRLEFKNLKWDDDDHETAAFICPNGCIMTYNQLPEIDAAGRWETLDGYYYDDHTDLFHDPEGTVTQRPKRIGAHVWSAYSYFTTWAATAEKWIEAVRAAKTGSKAKLKTVINTRLGETYEEKGESVNAEGFTSRLENYQDDFLPEGVIFITFGGDVQGGTNPRIEIEILGHGLDGESWSIDYVVLPGDASDKFVWDSLDSQLERQFTREDGLKMMITGGLIDSGFMTTEVYTYATPRNRRGVFPSKGVNSGDLCTASQSAFKKSSKKVAIMTVNTDDAKEIIFNRLQKTERGPGYCHFPQHYGQSYFDGLTNEQKKKKVRAGRLVGYEWVKIKEHMPNEPLDTRVYNLAALYRYTKGNTNLLQQLKFKQDKEAERIKAGIPAAKQTGRRVRSSGIQRT